MEKRYNPENLDSLLSYSHQLIGKTFLDTINENVFDNDQKEECIKKYSRPSYKGGLGALLEEVYFGYAPNSKQDADFASLGVELKSSPFEYRSDMSLRAGERLSITNVPFDRPIEGDFYNSDVWHKLRKILLIYYLRDKTLKSRLDYKIYFSYLYQPPEEDLKIIIDDYNKICNKIKEGKAHEISEGDTLYLGACTKGANAEKIVRPQFYGENIPAKKRNFCLKQSYMTHVLSKYIVNSKDSYESIVKDINDLKNITFEDYVLEKINKHAGKSDVSLCHEFKKSYRSSKGLWSELAYAMLGIKSNKAEEFVKANIVVKAIRIEKDGNIRENMSFPVFKYKEIIKETWENAAVREDFSKTKFLFVVFKSDGQNYILKGCQFWNMPVLDIETHVKNGWQYVVKTIKEGVKLNVKYQKNGKVVVDNNLLKSADNKIIHTRPHAQKSYYTLEDGRVIGEGTVSDANLLPDGRYMTNHCFWLNRKYILNQIEDKLKY